MTKIFGIAVAAVALMGLAGFATPSFAQDHVVKELNHGPNGKPDVFEPALVKINPGDSVTFEPTDPGHMAMSINKDIPAGAKPFNCAVNKKCTVTFTVPGVYAYKCMPHMSFGMVGMIVVGQPTNIDKLNFSGIPRRAHDRLVAMAAQVKQINTAER